MSDNNRMVKRSTYVMEDNVLNEIGRYAHDYGMTKSEVVEAACTLYLRLAGYGKGGYDILAEQSACSMNAYELEQSGLLVPAPMNELQRTLSMHAVANDVDSDALECIQGGDYAAAHDMILNA